MVFAYLDPGSGSLILQAVLGGVAGIGVAGKAMRNRLRARRAGKRATEEDQEIVSDGADEEAVTADDE